MVSFETKNGNCYAFDNQTGLIIPHSSLIESIQEISDWQTLSEGEIIEKLKIKFKEEDIIFSYKWLNKWMKFKRQNEDIIPKVQNFNMNILKRFLLGFGFKQIILSVTEDCNFSVNIVHILIIMMILEIIQDDI